MPTTLPLPWQPGACPYVTPDQLYNVQGTLVASQWPTGVQWGTIPGVSGTVPATPAQAFSVLSMICSEATVNAETITYQPLRAVLATEELAGPNDRLTMEPGMLPYARNGRFLTSRKPVTQVVSVQVCPNSTWPRQWTSLPAGMFEPEYPPPGLYNTNVASGAGEGGQGILFAPGWIDWTMKRNGWRVRAQYLACWPHAALTVAGTAGATQLVVDDCTGWAPTVTPSGASTGAAGVVYDALGGGQETFTCTSAVSATGATGPLAAGPGTITVTPALSFPHGVGIVVSSMPSNIIWATALLSGQAALARGATATTVQTTSGRRQVTGMSLEDQAKRLLANYRVTR